MPRVTSAKTKAQRHRKIKKQAKGFLGFRRRTFKGASEGILHALENAYIGRKLKKRDMRSLWITRINAALRQHDINYSTFINKLKSNEVGLNRKVLSEIAVADPETFDKIVLEVTESNDK